MKKVFLGGSRRLGKLNKAIMERADNIISKGYLVLLGDASGADRAIQKYLAEKSYKNVLIFCAGNSCRNNVGGWETRLIQANRANKDFQYYAIRDEKMSDEADYGFMIWDGKSKGTLNNIINLVVRKKLVIVYLSPKRKFVTLRSDSDIPELLSFCTRQALEYFERTLRISQRFYPEQSRLNFVLNTAEPMSSTTDDSSSFFINSAECDPGYKNVRDNPDLYGFKDYELKTYVESLWKDYRLYADSHFLLDACMHFQERFWEMYLGVTFLKHGFSIKRGGSTGPEFYLETNVQKKIWIEAIAPGPGVGADALQPLEIGMAGDSPVNEFILRLRHAIEEKKKKYDNYVDKGIISPDDIYIIGINSKRAALIPWDAEIPSIVKSVYPFGNLSVDLDKNTLKIKETRHEYRDTIQKKSGSPVSTAVFLDANYEGISAVIYSNVDCANKPEEFGSDFILIHNAVAKNKLDLGRFRFGKEYWIENGELKLYTHKSSYPKLFNFADK